jgi:hypothetical protein
MNVSGFRQMDALVRGIVCAVVTYCRTKTGQSPSGEAKGRLFPLGVTKYILVAGLLILGPVTAASAQLQILYDTPRGNDEEEARNFIQDEGITGTVSSLLNDEFDLRHQLPLYLGGNEGPMFDESSGEIHMPYNFIYDIAERFERNSYSGTDVSIHDVVRDAYLHALLHEISHALFVMYDLRTSGNLEKAVEALTVMLLLRYYENGGNIVINAAELYVDDGGAASRVQTGRDFWVEHELDRESYHQALCLVYGSDPQRYGALRDDSEFLQLRDRECVREYQRQVTAWFRVLGSFLKRPPPG